MDSSKNRAPFFDTDVSKLLAVYCETTGVLLVKSLKRPLLARMGIFTYQKFVPANLVGFNMSV